MFSSYVRNQKSVIRIFSRGLNSKIPTKPVEPPKFEGKIKLDQKTILHLERLSLVDFTNVEGIKRLEEAIEFAEPLREINTENVEPMFTVQDDATLRLGSYFWVIRKLAASGYLCSPLGLFWFRGSARYDIVAGHYFIKPPTSGEGRAPKAPPIPPLLQV